MSFCIILKQQSTLHSLRLQCSLRLQAKDHCHRKGSTSKEDVQDTEHSAVYVFNAASVYRQKITATGKGSKSKEAEILISKRQGEGRCASHLNVRHAHLRAPTRTAVVSTTSSSEAESAPAPSRERLLRLWEMCGLDRWVGVCWGSPHYFSGEVLP